MNCQETRQTLLEPPRGETGRQNLASAIEHLQSCPACRQAMNEFDRLWSVLQSETAQATDQAGMPAGGWSAFERRLMTFEYPLRQRGWRRPAILGGVAASLLAACLLVWAFFHTGSLHSDVATHLPLMPPKPTEHAAPSSIVFTPREVAQQVTAFDKMSNVYDRRTSWVLVSDENSDFGLADAPMEPQRLLVFRLVVLNNKRPISSADLAIVPGQAARLTLPLADGQTLQYRIGTSAGEQTRVAFSVDLVTADQRDRPIAALTTTLELHPGEKITAGRFVTGTDDYELDVAFTRSDLHPAQKIQPDNQERERQ